MGCDIVVLYVDTNVSVEHAVFIFRGVGGGGGDEARSKPIGMVDRNYRKN